MVSSVNADFFVDYTEPLKALAFVKEDMDWPLDEPIDGHEFLLILEAKRRSRSRSQGSTSLQLHAEVLVNLGKGGTVILSFW
jgi:hypothetical protein